MTYGEEKFMRAPDRARGLPTADERRALALLESKWRANTVSTRPANLARVEAAIKALYTAFGLQAPRVVVVSSPMIMAIAGGVAAAAARLKRIKPSKTINPYTKAMMRCSIKTKPFREEDGFWTADGMTYLLENSAIGELHKDGHIGYSIEREIMVHMSHIPWLEGGISSYTGEGWGFAAALTRFDATLCFQSHYQPEKARAEIHRAVSAALACDQSPKVCGADGQADSFDTLLAKSSRAYSSLFGLPPKRLYHYASSWATLMEDGNFDGNSLFIRQAIRDVFGIDRYRCAAYRAKEESALAGGIRVYHQDFCIVSDRPAQIHLDENGRLHCENGPAIAWRDGSCFYFWHGEAVPMRLKDERAAAVLSGAE